MFNENLLAMLFQKLYRGAVVSEDYTQEAVDAMLDEIDFCDLVQAVRHGAQTVYAYTTQGKREHSFNYRGHDLFGQRATLIFDALEQNTAEAVLADHSYELWLLEDYSLLVVSRVSVDFDNGAYKTEYRDIVSDHPWFSPMCLDLEELTDNLLRMCADVVEGKVPFYEM